MRMLTKYLLWLTLLLAAAILSPGSPQTGEQSDASFVAGNWKLVTLSNPNSSRTVTFTNNLAGIYCTTDNRNQKNIPNAVYKDGNLYFRVPDLQVYFEMRKVGDRFEGKMTLYGTNDKTAPEPVRMTKDAPKACEQPK